jgi:transporter family protein
MSLTTIAWCAVTLLAWGGAAIFDKLALNAMKGLSSQAAVMIRMIFAVLFAFIISVSMGVFGDIWSMEPMTLLYLALSGLFGAVIGQGAYYYATSTGEVSKVVAFTAGYPLVTVVLAILFLQEPVTWRKFLATAMIVAGLVILAASKAKSATTLSASEVSECAGS